MGRVIVADNPLDAKDVREYDYSGPFIEFLTEHYPDGFAGRPHAVVFNLTRLRVEDYDRVVGADDVVVLAINPGFFFAAAALGAFTTAANMVLAVVYSVAINYALNKFFGPKGTKPQAPGELAKATTGAASPTYNLNAPSNVARLGAPIPVAYGRNLIVPDLASQPYVWFENNQQYLAMIMCLGQGHFTVHDMFLAGSKTTALAPGVASTHVFTPSDHGQTFGAIQNVAGIYENVYTSPEVSDQELVGGASDAFIVTATLYTENGYATFWLDSEAREFSNALQDGKWGWLHIDDGANTGSWKIDTLYGTNDIGQVQDAWIHRKGRLAAGVNWVSPETGTTVILSYSATSPAGGAVAGPFAACPVDTETNYLQYDIVFPEGGYHVELQPDPGQEGVLEWVRVQVLFVATPIDNDGNEIGDGIEYLYERYLDTNTAQRATIHHVVPYARYQVSATRLSPMPEQVQDASRVYWTGLKAILGNTFGGSVYGDTTLVVSVVKATEGISSDAATRFSVDCTRKLDGAETRNPIDAFVDIFTNTRYGGRRPASELDTARVNELRTAWSGKYFDGVFDIQSSVWEAGQMALQMQHAAPTLDGGLITIVEDVDSLVPVAAFTEDTIKSLRLSYLFSDGDEPDGVEVAYRDPDDNSELYAIYPASAVDPEQIRGWGCRDYATALAYATRRWKQLVYRRRLLTMETELDAMTIPVGATVAITYERLLGAEPVLCVVNSVKPKDAFSVTVELHRREPAMFQ